MHAPSSSIPAAPSPRVVAAATPRRSPVHSGGRRASKGTGFLFDVIPAHASAVAHRAAHDILRGDELDPVALAARLAFERRAHRRVGVGERAPGMGPGAGAQMRRRAHPVADARRGGSSTAAATNMEIFCQLLRVFSVNIRCFCSDLFMSPDRGPPRRIGRPAPRPLPQLLRSLRPAATGRNAGAACAGSVRARALRSPGLRPRRRAGGPSRHV